MLKTTFSTPTQHISHCQQKYILLSSHLFEWIVSHRPFFFVNIPLVCPGGTVWKPHLPRAGGQLSGEHGQPGGSLHQGTTGRSSPTRSAKMKTRCTEGKNMEMVQGRGERGGEEGGDLHGSVGPLAHLAGSAVPVRCRCG